MACAPTLEIRGRGHPVQQPEVEEAFNARLDAAEYEHQAEEERFGHTRTTAAGWRATSPVVRHIARRRAIQRLPNVRCQPAAVIPWPQHGATRENKVRRRGVAARLGAPLLRAG